MKPLVTMREALTDPQLLGGAIPGESWLPWRTLLIASMGEALTDDERVLFSTLTGRESEPLEQVDEFWGVAGRRAGKTRAAGTLAAYVGGLCDHTEYLAPGERGVIPILANGISGAGRAFMHAKGVLEHSPVLSEQIDGEPTADTIKLTSLVDIVVKAANHRTVRGVTAPLAICDEVAFWYIEGSSNPDVAVLDALRPSMATTGGPLWVISSPHAKKGELYKAYERDFGQAGDRLVLVAKAPSRIFNSTLPERTVQRAYERDAAAAAAEYGAEFRDDIAAFITREVVQACVSKGVTERAYDPQHAYQAFVDPSGGRVDEMTLAIGHVEDDLAVVDLMRARKPPFSPEAVVIEFCDVMKTYGVSKVTGDRYAAEWSAEQFRKQGVEYEIADRPRSELYRDMLPMLNSRRADLLDSVKLVDQIAALERRVARGGKESIDHPPHGHDDLANAVAGVLSLLAPQPTVRVGVFLSSRVRNRVKTQTPSYLMETNQ